MVGQTSQLWHAMCFAAELALRIVAASCGRAVHNVVAAVAPVRKKVAAAVAASGRVFL